MSGGWNVSSIVAIRVYTNGDSEAAEALRKAIEASPGHRREQEDCQVRAQVARPVPRPSRLP